MGLNAKQVEQLLRPVNPKRVQKDNSGMSHLAAYDVSAHLTRIFGFGGWEKRITALELVSEQGIEKGSRTGWWVTYRCQMTLIVKDPAGNVVWSNDDGATGSASNLPSKGDAHDFALKNAISYALKRCAKDLGDQFGLSLYNKGSMTALVGKVLAADDETPADVESVITTELHPDTEDAPPDAPADEAPATSDALTTLTGQVATFPTEDAGRKLWRTVAAAAKDRDISRDDAKRLQDLITARIAQLRKTADPLSTYGLSPEDDWATTVASIEGSDDADAATADVGQQVKSGAMTAERGATIAAAIDARMAELAAKAAA
jgi:hypothetical protein